MIHHAILVKLVAQLSPNESNMYPLQRHVPYSADHVPWIIDPVDIIDDATSRDPATESPGENEIKLPIVILEMAANTLHPMAP